MHSFEEDTLVSRGSRSFYKGENNLATMVSEEESIVQVTIADAHNASESGHKYFHSPDPGGCVLSKDQSCGPRFGRWCSGVYAASPMF